MGTKKLLCMIMSLSMIMTMLTVAPLTAQAETYQKTIDGIVYEVDTTTGTAQVYDADSSITTANIKPEVDGYTVTRIGDYAFYKC